MTKQKFFFRFEKHRKSFSREYIDFDIFDFFVIFQDFYRFTHDFQNMIWPFYWLFTVRYKKKWVDFKMSYIFEKWLDFDKIFGGNPDRLQVFFCTYFQAHRTCFKKFRSKNAFFHFFKNIKKHIHDAKNSSSQLLALWIFFIFWIRVKTFDSYFFRYSKRDLESNWRF